MSQLSISNIDKYSRSQLELVTWLGARGYLALWQHCGRCDRQLQLVRSSRRGDKFELKCWKCKTVASIRTGSVFALFRAPLANLARLLVLFASNVPVGRASSIAGVDHKTATALYHFMRELIVTDLDIDPITFSSSDVVEIDETLVEALRGEEEQGGRTSGWVFGIISRSTGAVQLEVVPNREGQTLLDVMVDHVEAGAVVIGDSWPAYAALEPVYTVRTINKGAGQMSYYDRSLCIVVHTGTIEAVWSELRGQLHVSRGFPKHYVPLVLAEFMYRKSGRNILSLVQI